MHISYGYYQLLQQHVVNYTKLNRRALNERCTMTNATMIVVLCYSTAKLVDLNSVPRRTQYHAKWFTARCSRPQCPTGLFMGLLCFYRTQYYKQCNGPAPPTQQVFIYRRSKSREVQTDKMTSVHDITTAADSAVLLLIQDHQRYPPELQKMHLMVSQFSTLLNSIAKKQKTNP